MFAARPAAVRADEYPSLFGTTEFKSARLQPFEKWTGMLRREASERRRYGEPCKRDKLNRCGLQAWRNLIAEVAGLAPSEQIERVNAYLNKAAYIEDIANYGVLDYWATPLEFAARDGDCEDYAIAKFVTLRELGFSNDDLRIVVLDDLNLKRSHAVLAIYFQEKVLILDNQVAQVVPADIIRHYRPVYSINETFWWLHRPRG